MYSSNYDWYATDSLGNRLNQLLLDQGSKPLRLVNINLAVNTTLASAKPKRKTNAKGSDAEAEELRRNPSGYVDFNVPWNLVLGLVHSEVYTGTKTNRSTILNVSGDISITEKWKIALSSGYDFVQKDFSFTSIDIFRDLTYDPALDALGFYKFWIKTIIVKLHECVGAFSRGHLVYLV